MASYQQEDTCPDFPAAEAEDEAEVLLPVAHDSSSPVHRGHAGRHLASFSLQTEPPPQQRSAHNTYSSAAGWSAAAAAGSSSGSSVSWTAVLCLCGAHALARWGWRTWEFAVALILIKLFPSSLLLVSIFGLLDNIVRLAFGSVIGQFVDRSERLRGALVCYGIQNVAIALSAAAAAVLVWVDQSEAGAFRTRQPVLYWLLISFTLLSGASSSVGSLGAAVAVEREHAKTLCGDDSTALRKLNAGLRAIDLLSQMLGPVVSGLLMSYSSVMTAILVLAVYSLGAWGPEGLLLQAAHRHSHRLRRPKPQAADAQPQRQNALRVLLGAAGWAAYFNQSTLLAGLALALLYLTVLSLGFLMTSFLAWQGMSEATISLFRSAGALSGLMATLLFHPLQRWGVGLVGAGSLGVSWQLVFLLVGVTPVIIAQASGRHTAALGLANDGLTYSPSVQPASPAPTAPTSALQTDRAPSGDGLPAHLLYILLSGLVASRFGLWLFDLAVTQLQQELVPETGLGKVSGIQGSLQSGFEILSFLAGTIVSRPQHFHWLMTGSCAAVGLAACLFYSYAWGSAAQRQLLSSHTTLGPDCSPTGNGRP